MANLNTSIEKIENQYWRHYRSYFDIINGDEPAFKTESSRRIWGEVSRKEAVKMGNRFKKLTGNFPKNFEDLKKKR